MRATVRRTGYLGMVTALSLAIGACGNGVSAPSAGAPSTSGTADPVSLTLWVPDPLYEECHKEAVAAFEAQNPNVTVALTTMDWSNYQQQVLTGVGGGVPPDVIGMFSTDVAPWADQGILAPIDEHVDPADYFPGAFEAGVWNDSVYALPWGMQVTGMGYRADILAEAGIDGPPQTWAELRDDAQAVTERDASGDLGRVGFWIPTQGYRAYGLFFTMLINNGGSLFDSSGTEVAFNSPEGVEALEFLDALLNEDKVDSPGSIDVGPTATRRLAEGRLAMMVTTAVPAALEVNPDLTREQLGLAPLPYNEEPFVELGAQMLSLTTTSNNPEEALELLRFLTTTVDESVRHAACIGSLIPTYAPALAESEYGQSDYWIQVQKPLLEFARPLPPHPQFIEIGEIIINALNDVYLSGTPAQEALDAAAERANALLDG